MSSHLLLAKRAERGDATFNGVPDDFSIEHVVAVHEMTAHAVNAIPLDFGMSCRELVGKAIYRLAYLYDAKRAAVLKDRVALERFIRPPEALDGLFEPVAEP